MPASYSYTRNPYSLIPSWPGYIVMPSDGDPFMAQSANIFEKTLQDRNMFVLESAMKACISPGNIVAWSNDSVSISINPFIVECLNLSTFRIIEYPSISTITSANLDPAGAFAANTWYYVYVLLNNDNSTQLVITNSPPHVYLLYADVAGVQDKTLKYLFSFRTDGGSNIIPFTKQGHITLYKSNRSALNGGTAGAFTAIPMGAFKPPHAKHVYLNAEIENASTTAEELLRIGDGSALYAYDIYTSKETLYPDLLYFQSHYFWIPVKPATNEIFYKLTIGAAGTKAYIDVLGFAE